MSEWSSLILSALGSWIAGSIPFSLLIARWAGGIDLRQHGSGNVGATNVARTLGAKWGLVALLCDAAKGILPVLLLPLALPAGESWQTHRIVLCGVAAIVGHMYPPWLGFRGGKGVATALGVAAVLAPWSTLAAFLVFVVTMVAGRIVSLSSMLAALAFAIAQIVRDGSGLWTPQTWSLGAFSVAVPMLIIVRHRANIVRLWQGREPKLQFGKKERGETPVSSESSSEDSPT